MSDAGMMLGFAGLVGAVFLGLVAEAAISWASKGDDDESPEEVSPGDAGASGSRGGIDDDPDVAAEGDAGSPGDMFYWADLSRPQQVAQESLADTSQSGPADEGDVVTLAEVVEGDDLALIDDFDAETDHLVVVYDPAQHPDPALTLEPMPDGSGMTVMLDGVPLAEVPGVTDLRPEQVQLKPSEPLAA